MIARNTRGPGSIRFDILGSLSATSSPSARSDRTMVAALDPAKDSHEPLRSSHPRRAAQLTSAGAVSDRNPAMTPIEKHPRNKTALLTFITGYFSRKCALVNTSGSAAVVYFPTAMDYHYCGVISYRHLEDSLGTTCGRSANTLCYDCGTSLCQFHTAACDLCKEKFCPSCLSFHLDEHSKPSVADDRPPAKRKTPEAQAPKGITNAPASVTENRWPPRSVLQRRELPKFRQS